VIKISAVSQTAARGSGIEAENVEEMQSLFDALFFNVCGACSHFPIDQSLQITRHIMGSSSISVVTALSATPLSPAALKSINRCIHNAMAAL
jgi:hypothetical protein